MLDTILQIGATFDWISPLVAILGDMLNGPSHRFFIPYGSSPLSGREITWMLSKRGVRSWGHMVRDGTFTFSVPLNQARWAQYLLERERVPIDNPLPSQAGAQRPGRTRPRTGQAQGRAKSRGQGDLGGLADTVSEILNTRLL